MHICCSHSFRKSMLPWSTSFLNDDSRPPFYKWFIQFTGMARKGEPYVVLASEEVTLLPIDPEYLCLPPRSWYTSFTIRFVEYRCQSSNQFIFIWLVHFVWKDVTPWSLSNFTSCTLIPSHVLLVFDVLQPLLVRTWSPMLDVVQNSAKKNISLSSILRSHRPLLEHNHDVELWC